MQTTAPSTTPPASCVYVKQTLLDQLEREKRGLRWQLSHATKIAEDRAAEVAASKAQVKDLLTIVELNKTVADKAVQRNYSKECVLQQLHQQTKRMEATIHRMQHNAVTKMVHRRQVKECRQAWGALVGMTTSRRYARKVLSRWLQMWRHHLLYLYIVRWSKLSRDPIPTSAKMNLRYNTSFRAQNAKNKVAMHFARLRLRKSFFWAWKSLVRKRRRQLTMITYAQERRYRRMFQSWVRWSRLRRTVRSLLRRVLHHRQRCRLRQALATFRHQCMKKCMIEWGEVLKTARIAMEEEQLIYRQQQVSVMQQLESQKIQQTRAQERYINSQRHKRILQNRLESLRRFMTQWKYLVVHRRIQTQVAVIFSSSKRNRACITRNFVAWKRQVRLKRVVTRFRLRCRQRTHHMLLYQVFSALAQLWKRRKEQKRRLRAILLHRKHQQTRWAWWQWQWGIAKNEFFETTQSQSLALANSHAMQQERWLYKLSCLHRTLKRVQWQWAMERGDAKHHQWLRKVWQIWTTRIHHRQRQRALLSRLLTRRVCILRRSSFRTWKKRSQQLHQYMERHAVLIRQRQQRQCFRVFTAWHAVVGSNQALQLKDQVRQFALMLWKANAREQRKRIMVLMTLLRTRAQAKKCIAYRRWRIITEQMAHTEQSMRNQEYDLLRHTWSQWHQYINRSLRKTHRQLIVLRTCALEIARIQTLRWIWCAWTQYQTHERQKEKRLERLCAHRLRQKHRTLRCRLLFKWQVHIRTLRRQRGGLAQLMKCLVRCTLRRHFTRWTRSRSASATRILDIVWTKQLKRQLQQQILMKWKQYTRQHRKQRQARIEWQSRHHRRLAGQIFRQWKSVGIQRRHVQRVCLQNIVEYHYKKLLRHVLRVWDRYNHTIHVEVLEQVQAITKETAEEKEKLRIQAQQVFHTKCTYWRAWQSLVVYQRQQRHMVLSSLLSTHRRWTQDAWERWKLATRINHAMNGLRAAYYHARMRRAFEMLHNANQVHIRQSNAIQGLTTSWYRRLLRISWSQWKRKDQERRLDQVHMRHKKERDTTNEFMGRLGVRHYHHRLLRRVFRVWSSDTAHCRLVRQLLLGRNVKRLRRYFTGWSRAVFVQSQLRVLLSRIIAKQATMRQRMGFQQWKQYNVYMNYHHALARSQTVLANERSQAKLRIALARYSSWRQPVLASVFRTWRNAVWTRRREIHTTMERMTQQRLRQTMKGFLMAWHQTVDHARKTRGALKLVIDTKLWRLHRWGFSQWRKSIKITRKRESTLIRVFQIATIWNYRRVWNALRVHKEQVVRRQSLMVALSAQQALQQQRMIHVTRTMSFVQQKQQQSKIRMTFTAWKTWLQRRKARRQVSKIAIQRYNCRLLRHQFRAWRHLVVSQRRLAHHVQRRVSMSKLRLLRQHWNEWIDFTTRRYAARMLLWRILERKIRKLTQYVWKSWQTRVLWIAREREVQQVRRTTMALQHHANQKELLLLESIELKQSLERQRQKSMDAFSSRVWRIVKKSMIRRVAQCWENWKRVVLRGNTAQWMCMRLCRAAIIYAWRVWKQRTLQISLNAQHRLVMDKVAVMLSTSTAQRRRKKAWLMWRQYVLKRRKTRQHTRVVMMRIHRATTPMMMKYYFTAWKILVIHTRRRRVNGILSLESRLKQRKVQKSLCTWKRYAKTRCVQRQALCRLIRISDHVKRQVLTRAWSRWSHRTAEANLVMAKARVFLSELEQIEDKKCQDKILTIFSTWRVWTQCHVHTRNILDQRNVATQNRYLAKRALQRHFDAWKILIHLTRVKRRQTPVLCIQAPTCGRQHSNNQVSTKTRALVCSYGAYCRARSRSTWRVRLHKETTRRRLQRRIGLVIVLRYVRRQNERMLRRAFWRWFTRIQHISPALQTIEFAALPWKRETIEFPSTLLLIVLEEMDLMKQDREKEYIQHAWGIVNRIVQTRQQQQLRRAYFRWRLTAPRHRRMHRVPRAISAHTQAFAAKLAIVWKRRTFIIWKQQFIEAAMASAEAEEADLVAALNALNSYRRSLDPYSIPF